MIPSVWLKPGKEKPMRNRHPWIFSGAIGRTDKDIAPGSIVQVRSVDNTWLATAYYNHHSQIRCRVLSWNEKELIDRNFWKRRITQAVSARKFLRDSHPHTRALPATESQALATNSWRLIFGEADEIPGLIVDKYADYLVVQSLTAGIDYQFNIIIDVLAELEPSIGIYERSDEQVRELEGLDQRQGTLRGSAPPPEGVPILENGMKLIVDIVGGHKTGFYLDQRDARFAVRQIAKDKTVLNCFAYTGGFSVAAACGGAKHVTSVDTSAPSLKLAKAHCEENASTIPHDLLADDVFQVLRRFKAEDRKFDLIVLDPPKFAHNSSQIDKACRGYKDINRIAMQMLNPGGWLATYSCSGLISADLFQKVVFSAAIEASTNLQIMQRLRQAADHPVLLTFPEAEYLKGLLCRSVGPEA